MTKFVLETSVTHLDCKQATRTATNKLKKRNALFLMLTTLWAKANHQSPKFVSNQTCIVRAAFRTLVVDKVEVCLAVTPTIIAQHSLHEKVTRNLSLLHCSVF